MASYSEEELKSLGLTRFGEDVKISDKASIYNPSRISIGDHVRIDDFCVLAAGEGGIDIGDFVHIAVFGLLIGRGKITLASFSGLSGRVSIYSSTDDYTGGYLTNPTVPKQFSGASHADVFIGKHAIVGSGTVILPGVILEEGVAIGAMSLINKRCTAFGIYAGIPARRIGERSHNLLELEKQLRQEVRQFQNSAE